MDMIGIKVPSGVKDALQRLANKEHRPLGNLARLLMYEGAKARFGINFFEDNVSPEPAKRKKRT